MKLSKYYCKVDYEIDNILYNNALSFFELENNNSIIKLNKRKNNK